MKKATWMIEAISVQGKEAVLLTAKLPEELCVVTVAFYAPGTGWVPSAFAMLTDMEIDLTGLPHPYPMSKGTATGKDAVVLTPCKVNACCSDETILKACQEFDAIVLWIVQDREAT